MGNVEDVRKVLQDFIAPDLKAIAVRIDALEREMKIQVTSARQETESLRKEVDAGFKAVDTRFTAVDTRFTAVDTRFTSLEREMNLRFSAAEHLAASRHETVLNAMTAHHASIMNSLEMEKRLARLESERTGIASRSQEQ